MIGVFWLIEAFAERGANNLWWFGLISGLAMVILAFWTSGNFFIEKQYVLLVFAGVWALFHGVGDVVKAFQIRRLRDMYDCGRGERPRSPLSADTPAARMRAPLAALRHDAR